jgi:hypothetical protein
LGFGSGKWIKVVSEVNHMQTPPCDALRQRRRTGYLRNYGHAAILGIRRRRHRTDYSSNCTPAAILAIRQRRHRTGYNREKQYADELSLWCKPPLDSAPYAQVQWIIQDAVARADAASHKGKGCTATLENAKVGEKRRGLNPRTPEKQSPQIKPKGDKDLSENNEEKTTKEEARPVPDISVQAREIEKKVLAFCLDPTKKVNKDQTATIMRYFKDIRGIAEELLLHNSYLTGRLEKSSGEEKNKEMAILSAVNKSLQVSKRLETAVREKIKLETRKEPSYADKVKMTSNRVGQKAVRPPRNVVKSVSKRKTGKLELAKYSPW